jgi:hypothetical protein
MEWDTLEHSFTEKTNDWYASVILIAGALIAVEFLFNNFLLIVLTFIGTVAFLLVSSRRPEVVHVELRKNGVLVDKLLYPFQSLDGFAIIEYANEHRLLLESNRRLMPLIVIPVSLDVDPEDLHEVLAEYLPEKELRESPLHLLMERLGF